MWGSGIYQQNFWLSAKNYLCKTMVGGFFSELMLQNESLDLLVSAIVLCDSGKLLNW